MKTKLSILLITLGFFSLSAQIRGTVQDSEGNPLPGASIVIKGTTSGATTDFDGNFSINAFDVYPDVTNDSNGTSAGGRFYIQVKHLKWGN